MNPLRGGPGLPAFERILPEHVIPAVREVLAELGEELSRLEAATQPTWPELLGTIERMGDRLALAWGPVGHLMGVKNSEELRQVHETVLPEVVQFSLRLEQSQPIHERLRALRAGEVYDGLGPTEQRILDLLLLEARLAGVALVGESRERFRTLQTELAELATRFSNHVLDATKAFALTLHEPEQVQGLPPSLTELAAQAAREAGEADASSEAGPWRITLEAPSFRPFMEHCRQRELRERIYRAAIGRASEGAQDNRPLIARILELRREEATLLGFQSYAELSLASKMAPDTQAVTRLLEELREASHGAARGELEELRELARAEGAPEAEDLQHWDIPFWAERLREKRYAYRDEELRPYFPLPRVLEGLFALVQRLFGVQIQAADGEAPIWHADVRFFRVRDEHDVPIAAFYLDPYSRPAEKRGGAWMDECLGRSTLCAGPGESLRLPVAYLICNQSPPVGDRPSLMSFEEVRTLFHEFGHALQHMLTTVDQGLVSGIRNVEWDAVELASQFMENWCYDRATLLGLSGHVETGESLPEALFEKICAARSHRAGSVMLRQLFFSFLDLELHRGGAGCDWESVVSLHRDVSERTTILPPLAEDRFLCSFEHIFSGGYAAGYYGYKWAEVLSADVFAAFEEAGLEDERAMAQLGRRYRDTFLALGGSRPPLEVFRTFRGRDPDTRALLRHSGLAR